MAATLFDQEYLNKLERLQLLARRLLRNRSAGGHLSLGKGVSLEFNEYRRYYPGDDFRLIDWNVFSRTEKLYLKLFSPEHDLNIYILLDHSASMGVGTPPKIQLARQVAGSLGYIALAQQDRVSLFAMGRDLQELVHNQRSKNQAFSLFQILEDIRCKGSGHFNETIIRFMRRNIPGGLVVLITDLLDPDGIDDGLKFLAASRFDVLVIHLLDESEVRVNVGGPYILVDVEGGGEQKISLTPAIREKYHRRMLAYLDHAESFCRRHQIEYLRAFTSSSFEDIVLRYLRMGAYVH